MTQYKLEYYVTDNGKALILDWLKKLDSINRKRVLLRFDRLKNGNFGDYKQIDNLLYELRFKFGSGYRVYYTIKDETIVLLITGGDKKSQSKDIEKVQAIIKNLKGITNE